MYIKTDGIVLREVAYQDSDKLLTVLTREYGKLTVRARGVRSSRSRSKAACPAAGLFRVHAARARRALCRYGGHGKGDVSGTAERSGAFVAGVLFCAGRGRAQPGGRGESAVRITAAQRPLCARQARPAAEARQGGL